MKRIYFAGGVSKGDWRNDLVVGSGGRIMSNGYAEYSTPNGGKFIYGGPFAVSDDHGCFHQGKHGFGPTCGCSGSFVEGEGKYSQDIDVSEIGMPQFIVNRCLYQIERCDAVVANITKQNCYGSYFEIGFANALNKPIFLYCPMWIPKYIQGDNEQEPHSWSSDDLWFIKEATICLDVLEIPKSLLTFNKKEEYREYLQSEKWKSLSAKKRKKSGNKCQLCNNGNLILHVHHRTYENIYNEKLDDLIVLCEKCHAKFHNKEVE